MYYEAIYTQYHPVRQTKMSPNVHYVTLRQTYCSPNILCTVYAVYLANSKFSEFKRKCKLADI